MGAGSSTQQSGKLDLPDPDAFEEMLKNAMDHDDAEQRIKIKKLLKIANKAIGSKLKERSVGKIPFPPEKERIPELWKMCDYNGNGFSSLAELDKMIIENFPEYDNKPAIMRAYMAADRNKNGFIYKGQLYDFLGYLDYFTKLWHKFEIMDDNHDRRIDLEEMKRHSKEIFGRELSDETANVLFQAIDRNGGGKILFYEFAAHMAVLDRKDFTVDKLPFE